MHSKNNEKYNNEWNYHIKVFDISRDDPQGGTERGSSLLSIENDKEVICIKYPQPWST